MKKGILFSYDGDITLLTCTLKSLSSSYHSGLSELFFNILHFELTFRFRVYFRFSVLLRSPQDFKV